MGLFDFLPRKDKGLPKNPENQRLMEKIELFPGIVVPRAFSEFKSEIEKTKLSFIEIKADPSDNLTLKQSKFGHYPCIPIDFEYPKDEEGRFMYPLAQLNFSEMPALPGYPTSGYLQFYIAGEDDVIGLDLDDPQSQKNFRVLYFEEEQVEKHKTDFSFLEEMMKSDMLPVQTSYALSFKLSEEYIGIGDIRHINNEEFSISTVVEKYPDIEEELEEAAYDVFQNTGHKVGGYAFFTQEDPRQGELEQYILLFQMDSEDDIMWGDVGVANFFIHPADLARKDFSKVMYNWDCH